jgi:hypothetical protein
VLCNVKITPNFSFARCVTNSNRYMSVWKQRNAALVRMVPEAKEGEGEKRERSFGPSSLAPRLRVIPGRSCLFNLPIPMLLHW